MRKGAKKSMRESWKGTPRGVCPPILTQRLCYKIPSACASLSWHAKRIKKGWNSLGLLNGCTGLKIDRDRPTISGVPKHPSDCISEKNKLKPQTPDAETLEGSLVRNSRKTPLYRTCWTEIGEELVWDMLVRNTCGRLWRNTLVDILVGHTCDTPLWEWKAQHLWEA